MTDAHRCAWCDRVLDPDRRGQRSSRTMSRMDCPHGMPSPAACIDCMDAGNLPPAPKREPETVDYAFIARHEGQCPQCDLPVVPGERVAKMTTGRYLHEHCAVVR